MSSAKCRPFCLDPNVLKVSYAPGKSFVPGIEQVRNNSWNKEDLVKWYKNALKYFNIRTENKE